VFASWLLIRFGHTVSVTILLNTVFLAMEHHNMDSKLKALLSIANLVFLVIFTTEAALKILGLGIIGYASLICHGNIRGTNDNLWEHSWNI
jgi:hypothetical protein